MAYALSTHAMETGKFKKNFPIAYRWCTEKPTRYPITIGNRENFFIADPGCICFTKDDQYLMASGTESTYELSYRLNGLSKEYFKEEKKNYLFNLTTQKSEELTSIDLKRARPKKYFIGQETDYNSKIVDAYVYDTENQEKLFYIDSSSVGTIHEDGWGIVKQACSKPKKRKNPENLHEEPKGPHRTDEVACNDCGWQELLVVTLQNRKKLIAHHMLEEADTCIECSNFKISSIFLSHDGRTAVIQRGSAVELLQLPPEITKS